MVEKELKGSVIYLHGFPKLCFLPLEVLPLDWFRFLWRVFCLLILGLLLEC